MSERTLVAATQDELAARLGARPRLERTPLDVGWPPGGPKAPEHVWVDGSATDWSIVWASTGAAGEAPQDETFTLTVNFLVTRAVDTFAEIRDATLELAGELQTLLRFDWQLGGLVQSSEVTGGKLEEGYATDGVRQCLVELHVLVHAYLGATTGADG